MQQQNKKQEEHRFNIYINYKLYCGELWVTFFLKSNQNKSIFFFLLSYSIKIIIFCSLNDAHSIY